MSLTLLVLEARSPRFFGLDAYYPRLDILETLEQEFGVIHDIIQGSHLLM